MMLRGAAGRMQPWMHSVSSLGGAPVTVLSSVGVKGPDGLLDFRAVLLDGEIASRKLQGLIESR